MMGIIQSVGGMLLQAVPWTIGLTVFAFVAGSILAIPMCALRVSRSAVVRGVSMGVILVMRSIPPIVWLFIIFFGIGSGILHLSPFASGVIGLALITAANLAEIYRGAMKAVPLGQFEASKVLGLSRWRQYVDVLGPQIFRTALPSCATYAIGLVKDTAVASTIGVPEIAQAAYRASQATFKGIEVYAAAGFIYFVISVLMAWGSRALDTRLRMSIAR
ncbi:MULTISPECIES: amino acid ABC transporter permease [Paraburkholderia]|uniref:Amino acid ABC transporter permease n=1 Tax=Paraburkholderia podalyriae TaxID=1938811 RepID=A0ABR7PZI9_9BURK|nr:amino acid ABC transporter permease [Paraburkholderia podalyriae]MBC8751694.1 amino acid ABC transporter permease [Paraburkholderia podalyriae]